MAAFTEEQIKVLKVAFDSIWARMKPFQCFIEGDAMRLSELLHILHAKGVVTPEDIHEIGEIYVGAVSAFKCELELYEQLPDVMGYILRGEMLAAPKLTIKPLEEVESERESKRQPKYKR